MFKSIIIELLVEETKLHKDEVEKLLEYPPSLEMGDYSFPCFQFCDLSKDDEMWENVEKDFFKRKNPADIARHFTDQINDKKLPKEIEKVEAKGPYVNFFISKKLLAQKIIKIGSNFGKEKGSKKTIMMEYSQPNTHKAFHVGHIRGTVLGESLSRILEFTGNKLIRANYSGDTGMHIAKWIWCYQKFHNKEKLSDDESWIASIYVDAVKKLSENEDFQQEVNVINKKLDSREDKKLNDLWDKTKKLSIKSWEKIYKELGTDFKVHYFESEFDQIGKKIVKDLVNKEIAKHSEGAIIMDLEKYNLGIWVLLRKDGTVLYSAKDIALAKRKFKDYSLDEAIIITADEQNLHFKQLIKTLELMKFPKTDYLNHLGFAVVRLPHGKMSSRTGDNILYSNFKEGISEFAKKGIKKKWPKIKNKELEERAHKISMASIKYSMLSQGWNKIIIFDKEKALKFEGNTGPYLQYSYARASSILKKSKNKTTSKIPEELNKYELELISHMSKFPETVNNAGKFMNPSIIANYSHELAQKFNEFYHECKVIDSKEEGFRLKLIDSFRVVLKNSLYLLGIEVMEEM